MNSQHISELLNIILFGLLIWSQYDLNKEVKALKKRLDVEQ